YPTLEGGQPRGGSTAHIPVDSSGRRVGARATAERVRTFERVATLVLYIAPSCPRLVRMSSPTSSPDPEPVGPPDGADRSTTHRQPPGTDSPAEPPATAPTVAPISAAQLAELVG